MLAQCWKDRMTGFISTTLGGPTSTTGLKIVWFSAKKKKNPLGQHPPPYYDVTSCFITEREREKKLRTLLVLTYAGPVQFAALH